MRHLSTYLVWFEDPDEPGRNDEEKVIAGSFIGALDEWLGNNAPYCEGHICVHKPADLVTVKFPALCEAI